MIRSFKREDDKLEKAVEENGVRGMKGQGAEKKKKKGSQ